MSSVLGLAAVNFFLADVSGGLGPFLATWLAGAAKWSPERVGFVMTAAGLAGLLFNTPAGALVDRLGHPRLLMAAATGVVLAGTLALLPARQFGSVLASQIVVAVGAALIPPALTAMTLGIVGKRGFPRQQGRNQSWNHGGNVVASVLIVLLAGNMAGIAAFWVFAGMATGSGISLLLIRSADIDETRAHGRDDDDAKAVSLRTVLTDRRILLLCFGLTTFHLGNAAMLPLLGQRLADVGHGNATRWLAICVTVAQFAMIGVAVIAGWAAQRFRQSWLFVIPCCVLPIRGVMAAFGWAPAWLLPIQLLDACGAGLLGVAVPILIADYTWGSGRTQTALGVAATFQGIGASLSTSFGGVLVVQLGWTWAFLGLTAPAAIALAVGLRLHATGSNSKAAAIRARVYSSRGRANMVAASPSSTTDPCRSTTTRWASARTTLRSWLMNR